MRKKRVSPKKPHLRRSRLFERDLFHFRRRLFYTGRFFFRLRRLAVRRRTLGCTGRRSEREAFLPQALSRRRFVRSTRGRWRIGRRRRSHRRARRRHLALSRCSRVFRIDLFLPRRGVDRLAPAKGINLDAARRGGTGQRFARTTTLGDVARGRIANGRGRSGSGGDSGALGGHLLLDSALAFDRVDGSRRAERRGLGRRGGRRRVVRGRGGRTARRQLKLASTATERRRAWRRAGGCEYHVSARKA